MCVLTVAALCAGALAAAEEISALDVLEEPIDIELRDAAGRDVFGAMGRILQVPLELDPVVAERTVTIALQQVSARTALNALCESVDCRWRLVTEGEARLVVEGMWSQADVDASIEALLEIQAQLSLADASMVDVATSMAKLLEANHHLDPTFDEALLTIDVPRQSLRLSLDAICAEIGCRWDVVDSGRGEKPLLRIVPERTTP